MLNVCIPKVMLHTNIYFNGIIKSKYYSINITHYSQFYSIVFTMSMILPIPMKNKRIHTNTNYGQQLNGCSIL